ncbi:MAG TPA: hypothetical protein VF352_03330, partial [Anaerolineales bacterium]
KMPLAMKVLTTSGVTQTFVGCYTLHLAQPSLQATPPFQPLGIITGTFKQVANGTDVNALLPTACTTLPAATATRVPSNTPAPVATNTAAPNPTIANYLDDRSTPSQLIVSFYSAVNRQEYLRAYNYWINPSTSLGSFTSFANGYKDTASVDLVFGQITMGAGAGQIYYTVPVILKTTAKNGTRANWAACYVVHQSQPANFGEPPFDPMGIDRGSAKPSDINASDASMLATACSGYPIGGNQVVISGSNLNIDKNNYLDNRSGPVETVSSLLNALNLKQYVRAYSYFQNPATFPGSYDPYAAGYSDTDVITATFGIAQSQGAAGSLYYKMPLAMKVLTTSGVTQTFVGCYTLHLAQPSLQATPPFQPLGIITGTFKQVANGTDVNALLPTACN